MPLRSFFAIVAAVALFAATAAAELTYDLRLVGGGKTVSSLSVNEVVHLELYAVVTGSAGAQEGFKSGWLNVLSGHSAGYPIRGNLSATLVATFAASGSQNGTARDLDQDGDRDLGSLLAYRSAAQGGPASDGNYLRPVAASMQTSSGALIPNGREFKLANLTFTVTGIANPLDPTPMPLFIEVPNFQSPIEIEAEWQQDGISSSQFGLTPGGSFPNGFPLAGTPVMLRVIPEPSTGLLFLIAGAALGCTGRRVAKSRSGR